MEKLQGKSMDIVQDNIEKLKEIFPEIFTEGKIDFEVLKQLLGEKIESDNERYSFNWKGKTEARQIAQEVSSGTLRPEHNVLNTTHTSNLYIEGDNLEVLKLLQKSYYGKIKMIYIDPPYNTGKDFVYKDNFKDNLKNYLEITGQIGEEGQRLSTNSDSSGRYHSDWLNMMYPRLKLARNLLTDDGVIFISIDDNEQGNLKKLCDEIFGEENFVAQFPWRKRTAKSDVPHKVSQDYEWILCISKGQNYFASIEGKGRKYYETEDFPNNPWRFHDMSTQRTALERPNSNFSIINPKTQEEYPVNPNSVWRITKEGLPKYLEENRIIFPGDYDFLNISKPVLRYWKKDDMNKEGKNFGKIPVSTKFPEYIGMSQDGTKETTELLKGKIFSYPKPVNLISFLLKFSLTNNSIILDFFSGSATTAHAVMELNAEDGGNRKYIMVQLPELCDEKSEAYKAGYKNICEIGKERIRRAGEKIKADESLPLENREKLDIGFKVFKLDSSNIKEWDPETDDIKQTLLDSVDNIKSDRSSLDVLYEIILKYGLELTVPIEENEHFYSIGGGTLLINLDKKIDMEVIDSICEEYRNLLEIDEDFKTTVVLRDSAFKNDIDKTNAIKKLEQVGIKEVRSI